MVEYITSDPVPPVRGLYSLCLIDVQGTAAAQNYFSVLNPANKSFVHRFLQLVIGEYATGISSTANSIALYRSTAQSGGTLVDPATIPRFATNMPDPLAEVRIGNPSVTLLGGAGAIPVAFKTPIISSGLGNVSATDVVTPAGTQAIVLPGEGAVVRTAAGNTNQMYCMLYSWAEYQL